MAFQYQDADDIDPEFATDLWALISKHRGDLKDQDVSFWSEIHDFMSDRYNARLERERNAVTQASIWNT